MKLNKAPLTVSSLIEKLEEMKKELGDVEIWFSPSSNMQEGQDVEFESVATVSAIAVVQNDYKAVLLVSGKEYLKL